MRDIIHYLLENQLVIMFFSAFLSATILPGNSEVVLTTYASQIPVQNPFTDFFFLWLVASLGNSLGSLSTYALARLFPSPKLENQQGKAKKWAVHLVQKYGVWAMAFSWLPVVGDVLCAVAGWLRLSLLPTAIFITIGKSARYAVILWSVAQVVR